MGQSGCRRGVSQVRGPLLFGLLCSCGVDVRSVFVLPLVSVRFVFFVAKRQEHRKPQAAPAHGLASRADSASDQLVAPVHLKITHLADLLTHRDGCHCPCLAFPSPTCPCHHPSTAGTLCSISSSCVSCAFLLPAPLLMATPTAQPHQLFTTSRDAASHSTQTHTLAWQKIAGTHCSTLCHPHRTPLALMHQFVFFSVSTQSKTNPFYF